MVDLTWLLAVAPLPRTVNEALDMLDRDVESEDWLRDVLAAAGKLLVDIEPQPTADGVIVVQPLPDDHPHKAREVLLRPELSNGARRLIVGRVFDPARVGERTEAPALGDIGFLADVRGVVVGDDGARALLLTRSGPEWVSLARAHFRALPYDNRPYTAARLAIDAEGQPA